MPDFLNLPTMLRRGAALLTAGLSLAGCSSSDGPAEADAAAQPAAPVAAPVTTFTLTDAPAVRRLRLPGELKPFEQVDIFPRVGAFVKQVLVDRGTCVTKGQTLAVLEAPELAAQLARARSRWQAAQAKLSGTKASYDRLLRTSQEPGTISPNDLERARAEMQGDQAGVQAAYSEWQASRELSNYLVVRAPFGGVISARNVSAGALVGPGGGQPAAPMFSLENNQTLRLEVAVPEAAAGQWLKPGAKVPFTVPAFPGRTFMGVYRRNADRLSQTVRSELVEMDVPNANGQLKAGMYAQVLVALPTAAQSIAVPTAAVFARPDQPKQSQVIRVHDGRAQWVPVRRGQLLSRDTVEVFGPLAPGDALLREASEQVADGQPVTVAKPKPAGA
ncbi:efflux RND transporter periplasmic adaptor subunit [Hymenobacter properus]|uniref:Efflux RND transporter periplasmic adaptor subunit n=1 Tax=Hymenobacter properus TaxID=2791026 RepID=A0A931FNQ7_9BACT|nr:efflux RND transporter periplasmic adaptor subunit [Hymenobacter properus]MBF9144421.1 efflux RND transporter periplasmic adaptor subunit [Hymenobacter properus]MBR7723239.1 efflux RND transporter periplasmic adaptor subunit [Microvirga sp. SRT04]